MDLWRLNFRPLSEGGDDVTGALRKVDLNFEVLNAALDGKGEIGSRIGNLESDARALRTMVSAKASASDPGQVIRAGGIGIGVGDVYLYTSAADATNLVIRAGYAGHYTYLTLQGDGVMQINGARVWTGLNTTLDANKYIRSI